VTSALTPPPMSVPRRPTRPATMSEVARVARVSMMTVSRVVNDNESVTADTRQRVQDAMRRLDYRPNVLARGLVSGRSGTIGVVTFDTSLYGPGSALLGIERAAHLHGYGLSIATLPRLDRQSLADALDTMARRSTDGVIVIAPHVSAASALKDLRGTLPLVSVEAGFPEAAPLVAVDQRLGALLATNHLLELGHDTVWHIAGPDDWFESRARVDGWRAALTAAGAPVPELLHGDWSAASGHAAAQQLLRRGSGATAVFAANDQMALGFLHALYERGMTAPHPLSVVGFDDIPEAAFFSPSLTTVRQDFDEMGRRGVELLTELLDGHPVESGRVDVITPELVLRSSTAAPS